MEIFSHILKVSIEVPFEPTKTVKASCNGWQSLILITHFGPRNAYMCPGSESARNWLRHVSYDINDIAGQGYVTLDILWHYHLYCALIDILSSNHVIAVFEKFHCHLQRPRLYGVTLQLMIRWEDIGWLFKAPNGPRLKPNRSRVIRIRFGWTQFSVSDTSSVIGGRETFRTICPGHPYM